MKRFTMTIMLCVLLSFGTADQGKDPRENPNLSPFDQWRSAYDCLQNISSSCPEKYTLKEIGWVNVTNIDGESYCRNGCANHTVYVLQCLEDVMRGKFEFENKQTVKDINYTITQGCASGFTGKALQDTSSGAMMIEMREILTYVFSFFVWFAISDMFV